MKQTRSFRFAGLFALLCSVGGMAFMLAQPAHAQQGGATVAQAPQNDEYLPPWQRGKGNDAESPSAPQQIRPPAAREREEYQPAPSQGRYDNAPRRPGLASRPDPQPGEYGDGEGPIYAAPREQARPLYEDDDGYSSNEIVSTGHRFFGSVSKSLANVVEHVFSRQGRPNGYILGEEAGGAFIAGLRYGEGTLYTKNAGKHRVYWQGPSLGYDFGAEGSKTMILVYNLRDVGQLYHRFAGVDGSAYLVGGVGVTFQSYGDMVLAPIRSGVGLRLGANVGYLKYTRTPTWNPF